MEPAIDGGSSRWSGLVGAAADPLPHRRPDSADFVARLRAGDAEAFRTLVEAEAGRLLAVARRFLRDEDEAQDVVQEVFLTAFRRIASFQGRSELSTWLHRIAVNAALMRLRARRSRPERPIEDLLPRFDPSGHRVVSAAEEAPEAEANLQRQELLELVRDAIAALPESYRTVLLLRDIEELDTEETAALLGTTRNAVKIRLHRARQALRELLVARQPGLLQREH